MEWLLSGSERSLQHPKLQDWPGETGIAGQVFHLTVLSRYNWHSGNHMYCVHSEKLGPVCTPWSRQWTDPSCSKVPSCSFVIRSFPLFLDLILVHIDWSVFSTESLRSLYAAFSSLGPPQSPWILSSVSAAERGGLLGSTRVLAPCTTAWKFFQGGQ